MLTAPILALLIYNLLIFAAAITRGQKSGNQRQLLLLSVLFFFSGIPALIYQIHPAAEQALVAVGRVADELAKLNASMDKLIAAKGDAVRPAVEALAEQLIGFLDATDDEREEENEHGDGGADEEPSLGAAEIVQQDGPGRAGKTRRVTIASSKTRMATSSIHSKSMRLN